MAEGRHASFERKAPSRYERLELLGMGGMGAVYRAWDRKLGRWVAVKAILDEFAADEKVRQRFRREVQSMALVHHPNVVTLLDVDEADGTPYFSMELLEGETLRDVFNRGELSVKEVVRLVADLADGVAAVHGAGVVHRDIKPANVFMAKGGTPKLMDFGLVKLLEGDDVTHLTRTGQIVGTARYLPPEVLTGVKAGPAGDVYQLGLVLYEGVAGEHPFKAGNLGDLVKELVRGPLTPPTGPDVDQRLSALTMRSLASRPADRTPSAERLRDELRGWLEGRRPTRPPREPRRPSVSPSVVESTPTVAHSVLAVSAPGGKRLSPASMALGLAVVGLLVGLVAWPRAGGPAVPPGPTAGAPPHVVPAAVEPPVERDAIGWTKLHVAVDEGKVEAARAMLSGGGLAAAADAAGWTPLHLAAAQGAREAAEALAAAGAPLDARTGRGETPLYLAVWHGRDAVAGFLLARGARAGVADHRGRTPLHEAAWAGRDALVRALLAAAGGDPSVRDGAGQTPLHLAAYAGREVAAATLLSAGADPGARDARGRTPLHVAIRTGHPDLALRLLEAGTSAQEPDADGSTPLHEAAFYGYPELVTRLVKRGASLQARSRTGETALDYALRERQSTVVALLRAAATGGGVR